MPAHSRSPQRPSAAPSVTRPGAPSRSGARPRADPDPGGGLGPAETGQPDAGGSGVAERMAVFQSQARELLNRIREQAAVVAAAQAGMLRLLAEYTGLHPPADVDPLAAYAMSAPDELARVLRVSAASAGGQMGFASSVSRRLPGALQALADGVLDLPRLHSLDHAVTPLDAEKTTQVEQRILDSGPRRHRRAFTRACRRAVLDVDPDGGDSRAAERRTERHVRLYPGDDATSTLTALLPAEDAAACYQRLDRLTDTITRTRGADDRRTRDQIRADTLVDLITGRTPHAQIPCDVQVIVPVTTLLGLATTPGEIPGYGPIPGSIAREMAQRATSTWRRILTDPQGTLLEVAERRFPSPAQVRHVRARNQTCAHPVCTRPAYRTDTDHTHPHAAGGPTHTSNLGPFCGRHHTFKHRPQHRWTVRQTRPGEFTWTSPLGATTTTYPHNYLTGEEHTPPGPSH